MVTNDLNTTFIYNLKQKECLSLFFELTHKPLGLLAHLWVQSDPHVRPRYSMLTFYDFVNWFVLTERGENLFGYVLAIVDNEIVCEPHGLNKTLIRGKGHYPRFLSVSQSAAATACSRVLWNSNFLSETLYKFKVQRMKLC